MLTQKIQKLLDGQGNNYIFPFFWQHGEEESVLRQYMRVIHDCHIGAVCVESRPHPDFCGPRWWHDMDIILEEAKRLSMKVWILDDSHFPTGYANGAMKDQPDELCRQSLTCRHFLLQGGETLRLDKKDLLSPAPREKNLAEQYIQNDSQRVFDGDRLFSLCARNNQTGQVIDLRDFITENTLTWEAPEGSWSVTLLHLTRNYGYHPSYINMLLRSSCRVLIDAVYEPHYAHYKDLFGTTIAGFFSDEPELGNGHLYETNDPLGDPGMDYPWSQELEEELRKRLGEKLEEDLPLLWIPGEDPEKTARLRYLFMDAVSNLVRRDFSEQIGDWCHDHGVEYIGHLIEDDNHHSRTGSSLGHYFRGLSGQDMAGIDDIGGQVFPQGEDISYNYNVFAHRNGEFYHYLLGKLADSAAAIEPRKKGRSMCEIFGNYGWEAGVRLEKYLVDHFLVRGINHFVPHAFSPKTYPDPDCPPHFYAGGNNPQYRHFGALMAYTNRVCELMNDGRHIAPAAILYHGEADWTGNAMTDDQVGHPLADNQIDYDILPQDVFSEREKYLTRIEEGALKVNTQTYRVLLIPGCSYITFSLAQAIEEMKAKGIPVLYVGEAPRGLCSGEGTVPQAECIPLSDLVPRLRELKVPELSLTPEDSRIRYRHYVHTDGTEIYLFINEGAGAWEGQVCFEETAKGMTYLYDAWENTLQPVRVEKGSLSLTLEPLHSRLLIFDRTACEGEGQEGRESGEKQEGKGEEKDREERGEGTEILSLPTEWRRSLCRSIDYPSFQEEKKVTLPDHLAEEKPLFSGFVRYENSFLWEGKSPLLLTISDASEGVEVFLNGKSQGIQIAPPFRYHLSRDLTPGRNDLVIEVATTLERENSGKPDVRGQIKEPTSLSGITGSVFLYPEKE